MSKILVAYFSVGGITKELAQNIAEITNGDVFEIKPEIPYTKSDLDWTDKNSRTSIEMADVNSRPKIKEKLNNMSDYDIIFLGFPIWWYVAPTIINTFLESYDFSKKTIIPFATSGGSEMGNTEKVLHELISNDVNWKEGKLLNNFNKSQISEWIDGLNL